MSEHTVNSGASAPASTSATTTPQQSAVAAPAAALQPELAADRAPQASGAAAQSGPGARSRGRAIANAVVRPANSRCGSIAILGASVLWGSTGTASSLAPAGASAAAIGSAGLALGGLLLFLTTCRTRTTYSWAQWRLLIAGAVAVAAYPVTFYPAVARTGVAVATVVALCSAPVFTGLVGWISGRSRPTARWVGATAAAVIGCVAMVLGPELTGQAAAVDLLGIGLALCGGLAYVVYSLIGGELIAEGKPSGSVMGLMFGMAGLMVLPVVLISGVSWLGTMRGAAVALHLAVFTTFLAYRLFGYGLRHTTVATATTLTLAEPAVAAVLAVAVLGERLPAVSWCGLAVLAGGLALLTVRPGRR
ncbi:DMT family transporter [Nocardia crassostreae]|uniref:DMT family transporter n=1 Tax=Nocardia crassostreae TaxID=53428 RepID=UPI000B251A17|nr:EamA family transporter [Nocardia crassostreae]